MIREISLGVSVVIFCFFLSACAAAGVPQTPTPTITLTVTPTVSLTTKTPTSTATIQVSPTPTGLVWSQSVGQPIELEQFAFGLWSPTANEMVGTQRHSTSSDYRTGTTINLHSAPAFSAKVLRAALEVGIYGDMIWSIDGQRIFYTTYESESDNFTSIGTLWSIAPDGSNLQSHTQQASLGFEGWMDVHTLVFSGYAGGGTSFVSGFDVFKNDGVFGEGITGGPEAINANYMAIATCLPTCYVCVLPKVTSIQKPPDSYNCSVEPLMGIGDTQPFPRSEIYADVAKEDYRWIETIFQDWQPGTNNMLVLGQGNISNEFAARLLLWNADTNKVTSLAPGGLFGKFSPNGKMLAYITSGPSTQYPEKNTQNIPLDLVTFDDQPYLQIMDMKARQIMIRMPITADRREDYSSSSSFDFTKPDELSFSPDSRYLSFATDGLIALKDSQFPIEGTISETGPASLNILDLQTGELVQSLPLEGKHTSPNLSWAPTSEKFVFQDGLANWQLSQLSNKAISSITQANGDQLVDPAWSYDGSYLSFGSRYYAINDPVKTYILTIKNQP